MEFHTTLLGIYLLNQSVIKFTEFLSLEKKYPGDQTHCLWYFRKNF